MLRIRSRRGGSLRSSVHGGLVEAGSGQAGLADSKTQWAMAAATPRDRPIPLDPRTWSGVRCRWLNRRRPLGLRGKACGTCQWSTGIEDR